MRKTKILVLLILSIYFQNGIAQENKKLKMTLLYLEEMATEFHKMITKQIII
jgi:hypothetical protein